MTYGRTFQFLIGLALVVLSVTSCGQPSPTPIPPTATPTAVPAPSQTPTVEAAVETPGLSSAGRFALFNQIWALVRDRYAYPDYGGLDWEAVHETYADRVTGATSDGEFYALMQEMVEQLGDEYSWFVSPEQVALEQSVFESLEIHGGIGVLIREVGGELVLVNVLPGNSAHEAGLRPGERIVAVNGIPTEQFAGTWEVTLAIVGEVGTAVELTVRSPDGAERDVAVIRGEVDLARDLVRGTVIEGTRIGLLAIDSFESPEIVEQVRHKLQEMADGGPLDGLIVDVRTNPGGFVDVQLNTLGLFVDGGSAGSEVGRDRVDGYSIPEGETAPELEGIPVAVLIGPYTAAEGEIFAANMQFHGRALVAGLPSAGSTGLVTGHDLSDGSQLWLAEAVYKLPDGTMIEGRGVLPDLVVEGDPWSPEPGDDLQIQAAIEALSSE